MSTKNKFDLKLFSRFFLVFMILTNISPLKLFKVWEEQSQLSTVSQLCQLSLTVRKCHTILLVRLSVIHGWLVTFYGTLL
jgi:hypothetical protein